MNTIERPFARMGARVKFADLTLDPAQPRQQALEDLSLDVRRDKRGEFFLVSRGSGSTTELVVLDVQPAKRHLLLLSRKGMKKHRFLLGHDERHWFVAGIPEATPVSCVRDALTALKPDVVLTQEHALRVKERGRRTNAARIRQGEWFFVPAPQLTPPSRMLILRNEPLIRSGGGKAHWCEELFRIGGETVYVSGAAPNGLTEDEYRILSDAERRRLNWRVMRRNPRVYVRGRVRHRDHKTVTLDGWHQVLSNTEDQSYAMRNIAFLD